MIDEKVGPYLVRELINEGGTAALYVATGPAGETVALRVLLPKHRFCWAQRRMFTRGTKLHSQLTSDRIVKFHKRGSHSFRPYSVMEFIPGRNLRLAMFKNPEQLAPYKFQIILTMARAMQEVHDKGYVHLDLKPENFLVTPYWSVKLTDFDLCERVDGKPIRKKVVQGTRNYLAPELIEKKEFDQRADIFAFGIICYELLSGGHKPTETVASNDPNFEMQIRPLTDYSPEISKNLEKIILKCLATDMNDRYPAAWMLVSALEKELQPKGSGA
jgi:eukaryotic-like serine/threonine-protein kinase